MEQPKIDYDIEDNYYDTYPTYDHTENSLPYDRRKDLQSYNIPDRSFSSYKRPVPQKISERDDPSVLYNKPVTTHSYDLPDKKIDDYYSTTSKNDLYSTPRDDYHPTTPKDDINYSYEKETYTPSPFKPIGDTFNNFETKENLNPEDRNIDELPKSKRHTADSLDKNGREVLLDHNSNQLIQ